MRIFDSAPENQGIHESLRYSIESARCALIMADDTCVQCVKLFIFLPVTIIILV